MVELTVLSDQTDEYALACADFIGAESGADALGFDVTPDTGVRLTTDAPQRASRPMDLQGTRTITISASVKSQSHLDPHTLARERSVLAVIPAEGERLNTPSVWDQYINKEHALSSKCLDAIHLTLADDLGNPLNPNNHWAISMEIKFKLKESVAVRPSRKF